MRAILLLTLAACEFQATATATGEVDAAVGTDAAMAPTNPVTACTGYTLLSATLAPSSYQVVRIPATFKAAELYCEATQGHLVILDGDVERTIVTASLTNGWVGFSDLRNQSSWIDVAGRPAAYMAAHWALNEPSNSGSNNCAFLGGVTGLAAGNCGDMDGGMGEMRSYVCECGDAVQGNTNNFRRAD